MIGSKPNCLGARPGVDVKCDGAGMLEPIDEGLSVVLGPVKNLMKLPKPIRPFPFGESPLRVFRTGVEPLPDELEVRKNKPRHAVIKPTHRMRLDHYQELLASTQARWSPVDVQAEIEI